MSYFSDQIASCDVTGPALSTQRERLLEHRLVFAVEVYPSLQSSSAPHYSY